MVRIALQWPFMFYFLFSPLPLFAHFLISPRASFDTPWQWLRSINHPFPWTVSACLLWDETTAISSSAPPTPAPFSAWLSCQSPHTQQSNAVQCFSNHLVCFQAKYDIESLKLIKDDMSEIYATNARLWFKANSIRHLLNRAKPIWSHPFILRLFFKKHSLGFSFKDNLTYLITFFATFPGSDKRCRLNWKNFKGSRLPK